jgi:ATP-dependent helicase HrpA
VRYLHKNLPGLNRMKLQYANAPAAPEGLGVGTAASLEDELVTLILDQTFLDERPPIRDRDTFEARVQRGQAELMTTANQVCALLGDVLAQYHRVRKALSGATQINWMASISDLRQQLDQLVYRGFLLYTPYPMLRQFPRYLRAMELRFEKLLHAAARDQQRLREMTPQYSEWQRRYERARKERKRDPRLEELRWTFEELRVSLFAQELKTAYPVSLKRIEKRWKELGL